MMGGRQRLPGQPRPQPPLRHRQSVRRIGPRLRGLASQV